MLFFATPIIYPPDQLDGKLPPVVEFVLHWNPMAVFIDSFRQLLYHGHLPELANLVYLVVSAILSFVAGWAIFVKLSRRLAEEV